MDMMINGKNLEKVFCNLLNQYKYFSFATAWASTAHNSFKELVLSESKIKTSTIGLHFYQTEPKVLEKLYQNKNVKFVLQTNGVFHPKIYLFWNSSKDWSVLIGSANFTKCAFSGKNFENMIFLSNVNSCNTLFKEIKSLLESCFNHKDARFIDFNYINKYMKLYSFKHKNLERLSNIYSNIEFERLPIDIDILTYSWEDYFYEVKIDKYHDFDDRLEMLQTIQCCFEEKEHFKCMSLNDRKHIGGLPNAGYSNSGWFGSMIGNGVFYHEINVNNPIISSALDIVPLTGVVDRKCFLEYIRIFNSVKSFRQNPLGSSTRLITMKRPDLFFCINIQNNRLGKELGIKNLNKVNAERYWDEFLQRLYDTDWFNSTPPDRSDKELLAWKYRMALIDCIYYDKK